MDSNTVMSSGFPPAQKNSNGLFIDEMTHTGDYRRQKFNFVSAKNDLSAGFTQLRHPPLTFSPLSHANCAKGDM